MILSNEELSNVSGGVTKFVWYVIGGAATLIVGIVAGFINPTACK